MIFIKILYIFVFFLFFTNIAYSNISVNNDIPFGFEKPTDEILYVDVYFKRQFLISVRIEIKNNQFKFLYPMDVFRKIPLITIDSAKKVLPEFHKYHNFNSIYSCYPEKKEKCDMLNTNSVDFIYNPDNLSVEIIANEKIFLKEDKPNLYISPQADKFSQFFKFNGLGYWSKEKSDLNNDYYASPLFYDSKNQSQYNLTANSKTSFNRFILNSDINWTNQQNNLYFDNINLTRYYRGYNLQIGEFATEELRSLNQGNLLGFSFKTSVDRRRYDTGTFASPLNVFLNYRSRVNIIKDGRIYSSGYYDSGNQTLSTDGLPMGSYNVEIEIIEPNGKIKKERQFFVKNGELPQVDIPYFWLEGGALEKENGAVNANMQENQYFNEYDSDYLVRSGIYLRAFKAFGLGTNLMFNKDISAGELFLEYFGRYFSIRTSVASDTERDYSYNIYTELLNISKISLFFTWTQNYLTTDSLNKDYSYRPISSYSKQGNANIKYYFGSGSNSLGIKANYFKDYYNNENYSIGPDLEFNINFPANIILRTTVSAYRTDRDYQASINFFLNFNSKYVQLAHNSSYKMSKERSGAKDFDDSFDSSTVLTLQDGGIFSQDLRFTARYDEANRIETKALELDYRSGLGRFTADASTNSHINQYSLNFASIFAFNKNSLLFGGREIKESAVAIEIDGGNKDSKFDIYVNQNKTDFIKGNSSRVITLNPFNEYKISLQATGDNNTYVEDNKIKIITLYPGYIETIKYKAKATVILIGTLYSENGKILRNVKIQGSIDEIITDSNGDFQITAVLGETLNIDNNKASYRVPKKTKNSDHILILDRVEVDI